MSTDRQGQPWGYYPERDYGMGNTTEYVRSVPRIQTATGITCPRCGCADTYMIEVAVDHPNLKGGTGTGTYVGCAACPYASPMVILGGGK